MLLVIRTPFFECALDAVPAVKDAVLLAVSGVSLLAYTSLSSFRLVCHLYIVCFFLYKSIELVRPSSKYSINLNYVPCIVWYIG